MSIPFLWEDELAFLKYNKTIFEAATPAVNRISDIAEANGAPHSKIISTTPNNLDSPAGAYCKSTIDSACVFIEEMYDWSREEVLAYIHDNSINDFLYIKYTWKQLGYSDDWYEKECRSLQFNWLTINREINLVWTKSTDNSVFNEEQLMTVSKLLKSESENLLIEVTRYDAVVEEVVKNTLKVECFDEMNPDKCYFIGVDVAGGLDQDNSTFVMTDPTDNYRPVAFFKNPKIDTTLYSRFLTKFIKEYFPKSILFIENNSYGRGLITNLLDTIPKNIYYDYSLTDKNKTARNPAAKTDNIRWGINTNETTRQLMMDILVELVNDTPQILAYPDLYDDLRGLIYNKRGKIEHEQGMHDDTLMAYLVLRYAVQYGNNITKFLREIREGKVNNGITKLKNVVNNNIDDPAVAKGANINILDVATMVSNGMSVEEAIAIVTGKADKGSTKINNAAVNTMLNKNLNYNSKLKGK